MRTLSRPMFNMGGPIKQGIMHGIREPHKYGGPTGTGLVGDQRYPQTGGREHHFWNIPLSIGAAGIRAVGTAAARRAAQEAATRAALSGGLKKGLTTASGTGINAAKQGFWRGAWEGDPLVKGGKWLINALKSPKAATLGEKVAKTVVSPTGLLTSAWLGKSFWPDGTPKEPPKGLNKPGGFPDAEVAEKFVMSDAQKKAFANKQRDERVQKYMDMMGYDRAKKTAIGDALIDASKIVGDRGTLDLKNITQELINPVIQATSKRLDKPEQIREAVGLMATKAEIEKDLTKETDALKTKALELQIQGAENTLAASQSFEGGLSEWLSSRKGAVAPNELEQFSRLLARKHKEPFKKVTGDEQITVNGIYMKDGNLFRVTEGVSEQLV